MTEHLSSHTIELLTGKRLAPEDLLAATRHLAACVQCRQKASEAADVPSRVPHLGSAALAGAEDLHPAYEQLEAYVDDALDVKDREDLKRHFASCAACSQEANELELLRDNLNTYPTLTGLTVTQKKPSESSWERLAGLLQMRPVRFASFAAALLLMVVIAVLLIRRPTPQEIVNNNSSPSNNNAANQNDQVEGANTKPSNINPVTPNGPGEVVAASSYENIVRQAIETQKITTPPAIQELNGKESSLLGSSEKPERFALISPVATFSRSNRPRFRWQRLPGASSYSVAILDLNLNVIEESGPTPTLSWIPRRALKRNVVYLWQVTAVKDGREITAPAAPAREARFRILSTDRIAALSRASIEFADSHLKLGIVYAHEGLLDDAEREFRAAIAADQEAALARRLLQSARQLRHLLGR